MSDIPQKNKDSIDFTQYQNDPDLMVIVNQARIEYEKLNKAFPGTNKEMFFGAFVAGYVKGINVAIESVKSIDTIIKKK